MVNNTRPMSAPEVKNTLSDLYNREPKKTQSQIAEILNKAGMLTPDGFPWHQSTVSFWGRKLGIKLKKKDTGKQNRPHTVVTKPVQKRVLKLLKKERIELRLNEKQMANIKRLANQYADGDIEFWCIYSALSYVPSDEELS